MVNPLQHHASHPFVIVTALISMAAVLFVSFVYPVSAATLKAYKHATHGYQFQYPSTWSTTTGTKAVTLKPPAKTLKTLLAKGVSYTLNTSWLNNDPAAYTPALKTALAGGWTKFVSAYGTVLDKKYGVKPTVKTYAKPNWTVTVFLLKRRVNNVPTTWRFVVLSKDKKKVFLVGEKWTKNVTSPFAADVATLLKSFTTYTTPDTCGNAIGNGSTIVAGPSAPNAPQGGGDYDSTFHSLTVHPTDPQKVWVGTERNGVLYTADGGTTWSRYRYGIRHISTAGYTEMWNMDISVVDPTKLLIAGNDSPGPLAGDYPSNTAGIYRSTDSGQTWTRKNCGLTNAQVSSIVFDPANSNIAYAGGRSGYPSFAKAGDAVYKLYAGGIYRTTDAGANWKKVTLPGPGTAANNDFWQLVARGTPTTYFSFGLNYNNPTDNVGFVKSTDGVTWTAMGGDYRTRFITEFDVSADGQHIVASVRDGFEYIISDDGGATWSSLPYSANGVLAISPADSNRIIYSTHSAVYLTTDRFQTSAEKSNPGVKIQDIVFAPADPNVIYFVAAGYLFYKSTDAGATFTLVKNLRSEVINVLP